MKRKPQTLTASPASVRLYREDLDFIVDAIREDCQLVTITDKEHEFESLDELASHSGRKVDTLAIRGSGGGDIDFTIARRLPGVLLLSSGSEKAFYRIRERLVEREKPIGKLAKLWKIVMPLAFIAALVSQKNVLLTSVFLGIVVLALLGLPHAGGMLYTVHLTKRAEKSSFIEKFGTEIMIAAITALITAIVTWAITKTLGP